MTGKRVERRLCAVLAADVAGYSRLMGADELGTLEALKAHRREVVDPAIGRNSGRIVKTTGDGLLVEFASAVDAVTCAVEVQREMAARNRTASPRIVFRIGINVGDIIIDGDDIFGDGVNVAARIETACEPGGVYLSDDAFRQVRGKTAFAFDDTGEHALKNIAPPVRIYAARLAGDDAAAPATPTAPGPTADGGYHPPVDRASIAVLPFQNMSGDPEQEHFADGMVEDIITALSRIRTFFVIARNSTFTYKGKAVDIKQVGRDLGVQYVMEGSVRRSGNRIRVTAQLIDASTGRHVWAEKYDRVVEDLFDLQDDLTQSVCAATQTHLTLDYLTLPDRTDRPDLNVWLLTKKSWQKCYLLTPAALDEARALAEEALKLDPESTLAHEILAAVLVHQVFMRTVRDRRGALTAARRSAEKAIQSADATEYGYWAMGLIEFVEDHIDQAIRTLRHGLRINPNCALIIATIGNHLALAGQADESIAMTELSMRINPRDPSIFFRYQAHADAYFVKRDFRQMIEWAARAITAKPSYFAGHTRLLVGLALLDRRDELEAARQRYVSEIPAERRTANAPFARKEDADLFLDGLTRAGLV